MKILVLVFLVLNIGISHLFSGDTKQINISVGYQKLNIKSPDKFHEVSNVYPEYKKIGEIFTPPQNLFLGMFVSETDLGYIMKGKPKELSRCMILSTLKELKHQFMSYSKFESSKEGMKKKILTSLDEIVKKSNASLTEKEEKILIDYGKDFKIQIGEVKPLGILFESKNALTIAYLIKVKANKKDSVVVVASSMVLIKSAYLMTFIYSDFNSQKDIDWVGKESKKWIESIQSSNQ